MWEGDAAMGDGRRGLDVHAYSVHSTYTHSQLYIRGAKQKGWKKEEGASQFANKKKGQ